MFDQPWYKYSYLYGDIILLVFWAILFWRRKDLRYTQLIMSFLGGFSGLFAATIYNYDWWRPITILGTYVGIEDFLYGFTLVGIASVVGKHILDITFTKKVKFTQAHFKKTMIVVTVLAIIALSLVALGMHSFHMGVVVGILFLIFLWIQRKDLIKQSLVAGVALVILCIPFYLLPQLVNPVWVQETWFMDQLIGIIVLGAPIEDYVWVFVWSCVNGIVFDWMAQLKTKSVKRSQQS